VTSDAAAEAQAPVHMRATGVVPVVGLLLREYARNPVNLFLLAIVPVVFVAVVAPALADAGTLVGGTGGPSVETASAGWSAAFLSGIAMYFQVAASRDADRRLVLAGLPTATMAAARLVTGLALAAGASMAALLTLAAVSGIADPVRVSAGTLMFALVYLAVGAVVGALVPNSVNGTVVILFVWIFDVFFGPVMTSADLMVTRVLPGHWITLWSVDLPSGHAGRSSDLGWSLLWVAAALALAALVVDHRLPSTRPAPVPRDPGTAAAQFVATTSAAWRDARRNPVQWALLVAVPLLFILAADAVTQDEPLTLTLREGGRDLVTTLRMPDVHGATMAPIAVASLAALAGLFGLLDNRAADRRTAVAGMRAAALFGGRLAVLVGVVVVASAVSLAVTAAVVQPQQWLLFTAALLLVGATYALVGALLAPLVGRVGGVFLAFLLPFLDLGVTQSPMLHPEPTTLATLLPGYGSTRMLLDAALTQTFDASGPLGAGLLWLALLLAVNAALYRRSVRPALPAHSRVGSLPERAPAGSSARSTP
jgi:hypothetical protein